MGNKHVKSRRGTVNEYQEKVEIAQQYVSCSGKSSEKEDALNDSSINSASDNSEGNIQNTMHAPIHVNALLKDCLRQLDVYSVLSTHEISAIRKHLETLLGQSKDEKLTISKTDFFKFLNANPDSLYVNRLYGIFDTSSRGNITFEELIRGLAILSRKASREQKLLLSFHLLDVEGSGFVTKDMTMELLRSCVNECREVGLHLSDKDIEKIVEQTFLEADVDKDQLVTLEEYKMLDSKHSRIFDFLTIDTSGVLNQLEKVRSTVHTLTATY